ncbi:DUF4383 domain-containing protein [Amycolatopsis anabasis]|uniref:DUF4383 domain-containing protein n=1 Tax=Amycolatopsis anabasis TaxID=1840409 RepID=UPI00131C648B|nr:DUF4383 domain-containing protein [Amycolatopsis anabasis]
MARSTTTRVRVAGLQPVQVLAGLVGLVFLVVGVIGFVRTGFGDFTGHNHASLWIFSVNPLHNLVHVVIGLLGLLMATGSGLARTFGWILLVAYGAVLVWGLFIVGAFATNPFERFGNPLNLGIADNWLHLGAAVVGLVIAVLPARKVVLTDEESTAPAAAETTTETEEQPRHGGAHRRVWQRRTS